MNQQRKNLIDCGITGIHSCFSLNLIFTKHVVLAIAVIVRYSVELRACSMSFYDICVENSLDRVEKVEC
jgi:hypothetical protein